MANSYIYGSVSGQTKKATKLYGAYGVHQEIQFTSYISAFDTDNFITAIQNYSSPWYVDIDATKVKKYPHIVLKTVSASQISMLFRNDNGNYMMRDAYNKMEVIFTTRTGFTATLTPCVTWAAGDGGYSTWDYLTGLATDTETQFVTAGFPFVTKRIKKLYGSVSGLTKLAFEDPNA